MPFNTNSKPGTAQIPVAIGDIITNLTAGSILFGGAAGILAQDNASLFFDDTNNKLGVGINSSLLARIHAKGFGATAATSAFIATNGSGERIIEARDDKSVFIGTYAQLSDDGTNFKFKTRYDEPVINIRSDGNRAIALFNNSTGGIGSFSTGFANNVATGENSFAMGEYSYSEGVRSFTNGMLIKAIFENQKSEGISINTNNNFANGYHRIPFGYAQPAATTTAQNTLIPLKSYNFGSYFSTYNAMLCKVKTTIIDSLECQTLEQTFTIKMVGGAMSIVGAIITDYNGGDAAMSTGNMTYSFAANTISIGYTTPTVRANGAYYISTVFEFNMIGY